MKTQPKVKISVVRRELGIDQVTPVAGFIGGVATTIVNLDADRNGEISLLEGANAVQVTAFEAFSLFRDFDLPTTKAQFLDADSEEKELIVDAFAARFGLENPVAEKLIEDYAAFFFNGYDLIQRTIALQQSKKNTGTSLKEV